MVLLYASQHEVKHVSFVPRLHIGRRARWLKAKDLAGYDDVLLFGCCGALMPERKHLGDLVAPFCWSHGTETVATDRILNIPQARPGYTARKSVHSAKYRLTILGAHPTSIIVDTESFHVAKVCKSLGLRFQSVRYVIDGCERRIFPLGINWLWRQMQHTRMQRKFQRLLVDEGLA